MVERKSSNFWNGINPKVLFCKSVFFQQSLFIVWGLSSKYVGLSSAGYYVW